MPTTTRAEISIASRGDLGSFTKSNNKYSVIGVAMDASTDEIKRAYRKLAMLYHPDRHPDDAKANAEDIFKRITAAYETLSDAAERAEYDRMLARGRVPDLGAEARNQQIEPLERILADILRYQHIFDPDLSGTPGDLREDVRSVLIEQIASPGEGRGKGKSERLAQFTEKIVGDMPLSEAPEGVTHQGSFVKGAMVLTNLRLLVAFRSQLVETRGNTQTTYTWRNLGGVAFPAMASVSITLTDRIARRHEISIDAASPLTLVPKYGNLGKLLLLCSLWGIPVLPRDTSSRAVDRTRVLWSRPMKGVVTVATLLGLIFVCRACNGAADLEQVEPVMVFVVLYLLFVPWALLTAWGLVDLFRAYGRQGVEDLLTESTTDD